MQSIVEQEYQDFEVVVSDDSTHDDVYKLVERYKTQLPDKIRYYRNSPSLGSPANWNYAIFLSKYDIIKIMHHDDYFTYPYSLRKLAESFKNNTSRDCFVVSGHYNVRQGITWDCTRNINEINDIVNAPGSLFNANIFGTPSNIIFRKSSLSFSNDLIWLVDVDFYVNSLLQSPTFVYLQEPLITCVFDSHNLTNLYEANYLHEVIELNIIYRRFSGALSDRIFLIKAMLRSLRQAGIYNLQALNKIRADGPDFSKIYVLLVIYLKISFVLHKR